MVRVKTLYCVFLLLGLVGCGINGRARCEQVCDWWISACSGEDRESCMSDCRWADESASSVVDRCVEGNGWNPNPDTCQSASCCVRFVYFEDEYQRQCL